MRDLSIFPGNGPSSDEKIDKAVAVDITGRYAGCVDVQAVEGMREPGQASFPIVKVYTWRQNGVLAIKFISSAGHYEVGIAIVIDIDPTCIHVLIGAVAVQGRLAAADEFSRRLLQKDNAL